MVNVTDTTEMVGFLSTVTVLAIAQLILGLPTENRHIPLLNVCAVLVICAVCLQCVSRDKRFPSAWVNSFMHPFYFCLLGKGP